MNFENLPEVLRKNALWCLWKREERGKVPYSPTGGMAKSNDPSTFSTYETAYQVYAGGSYDGLGVGIFQNIGAIDIDHCITDGKYSDMAKDIIEQMGSYTEISPSGIRIIFTVSGFQYDKDRYYINNQSRGLEVYVAGATKKFVTITGNKINDNPVIDGTENLPVVLDKYMLRDNAHKAPVQAAMVENADLKDYLKIGIEKDEKLRSYWNGARPGKSESENDMGFMSKLMYWCNNDAEKAIQAFRSSPYVSKKDEKHQQKMNRLDYLPRLAKLAYSDRTAAQDNEHWEKEHLPGQKYEVSKGLNIISAQDLQKTNFPPTKYLVEDLLPEGTSILAAAPKSGKSWFVLLLGLKIAAGEPFLRHRTNQAGVLYLSFEDTKRRLKDRMNKLLSNAPAPVWFDFSTEIVMLEDGLLDLLDEHIKQKPQTKLIIIDTLQKIRGGAKQGERWYEHDYREAGAVKEFADKKGISVLFVHHVNKTKDKDNPFNEIGGTNGISGVMDTMFVMRRKSPSSRRATLYITGRDVEQDEFVMNLNEKTCQWEMIGNADEFALWERKHKYESSPIVKTIRTLLRESSQKRWKGSATDLRKEGERLLGIPIPQSSQQIGKQLAEFIDLFREQDHIIYTVAPNGNAGNNHCFCLDFIADDEQNRDEETVEF